MLRNLTKPTNVNEIEKNALKVLADLVEQIAQNWACRSPPCQARGSMGSYQLRALFAANSTS
eukprot:1688763-Prorocentrum_lima.AAC.1